MKTKRTNSWQIAASLLLVAALAPSARADFSAIYASHNIAGPAYTFDALNTGWVTSATNTLTQPAGFTFTDPTGEYIAANADGGHVLDILGEGIGFDGFVRFTFNDLVDAAGVDYSTATTLSLLAYNDNGDLINAEGTVMASAGTAGFFGIASDVGIREILIHDTAGSFQLDNLRFGAIAAPVPAAWVMGVLGLGLVGVVRRRI